MQNTEQQLRERLGVPRDAKSVIIFGETSHWDPNWLFTAEEYYRLRIRHILDQVVTCLLEQPRRVFSVESTFFFKHYWDRATAERQQEVRELVNSRRIRLTGSGVTTPDTLLPDTEPILRDYLLGQQWMLDQGMTQEPRLAYLPDDFGHSPALPSLLRAMGYTMAGVTRIDGMYFTGSDFRFKSSFPLEGSSAQQLLEQDRTLDFVWRAPDGSEVLCHWNAYTYFQGDMLACVGVIRWMGITFGLPWRTERHVARRISQFEQQLAPYARTPYLFCPIGCDFNGPIRDLVGLLDRYNERRYEHTGVWAVNAGMDDYLELVGHHRHELPTLELDPNPYWMGFYATRPEIKRVCNEVSRRLVLTEKLASIAQAAPDGVPATDAADASAAAARRDASVLRRAREAWDLVVVSNHHDFITGTSPDRVWNAEQRRWLQSAEALSVSAFERIKAGWPDPPAAAAARPPRWQLTDGRLEVCSTHYALVLSEQVGGCMVSYRAGGSHGDELLRGPANDLVAYRDWGGLWRLGHEFAGGKFEQRLLASQAPATIKAQEYRGQLEIRVDSTLGGRRFIRWIWLRADSPVIRMRLIGSAANRLSIACRFPTVLQPGSLMMDVPGGVVQRPLRKLYDPTFWSASTFAHAASVEPGPGAALMMGGPACVAASPEGTLECLALRNAPREVAWGFIPIPAHPAAGRDGVEHVFDYALWLTPEGDYLNHGLPRLARQVLSEQWVEPGAPDYEALADRLLAMDNGHVLVTSVKPATRGSGLIARLESPAPAGTQVRAHSPLGTIRSATLCDALERDLEPLKVTEGKAQVPLQGALTSIRLQF